MIEGSATTYPVTGEVTINVTSTSLPFSGSIYAKTSDSSAAKFIYNGHADYTRGYSFVNAGDIEVQSGHLEIKSGSTFFGDDRNLKVTSGYLYLNSLGNSLIFGNFEGGGSLILGQNQGIWFTGTISGETSVYLDNKNFPSSPVEGVNYITGSGNANAFSFIGGNNYYGDLPTYKDGVWAIQDGNQQGTGNILVRDFSVGDLTVNSGSHTAELTLSVDFDSTSSSALEEDVPFELYLGDTLCTVSDGTYTINNLEIFVLGNALIIQTVDGAALADNTYSFKAVVPMANSSSGAAIEKTFTLVVGNGGAVSPPVTGPTKVSVPEKISGLVYSGQTQVGVSPVNGVILTGNEGINAGDYQATAVLESGYAWSDGSTGSKTIDWSIGQKPVSVYSAVLKEREYDGSTAAEVVSVLFSDGQSDSISISYEATASFDTNTAGVGKAASVVVTLKDNNYSLAQNSVKTSGTIKKKTVTLAAEPTSLAIVLGSQREFEYALSQLTAGYGTDLGQLSYSVKAVNLGEYYKESIKKAYISGDVLKVPIQSNVPASFSSTGSIQITVSGVNINDFVRTIPCSIAYNGGGGTAVKIIPTGTPTVSKTEVYVGDKISSVILSGTMKDGGVAVPGHFSWENGNDVFAASGQAVKKWIFTPGDGTKYDQATGSVIFNVKKRTPSGAPTWISISAAGKTLADANLSKGTINVEGAVSWVLDSKTAVTEGSSYQWIFVPKDEVTYERLRGSAVLYRAGSTSSGSTSTGGSAGGTSSGSTSTGASTGGTANISTSTGASTNSVNTGKTAVSTVTEKKPVTAISSLSSPSGANQPGNRRVNSADPSLADAVNPDRRNANISSADTELDTKVQENDIYNEADGGNRNDTVTPSVDADTSREGETGKTGKKEEEKGFFENLSPGIVAVGSVAVVGGGACSAVYGLSKAGINPLGKRKGKK